MITMCATRGLVRVCHVRVTCILIVVFKRESIKRLCVTEVSLTVVRSTKLNYFNKISPYMTTSHLIQGKNTKIVACDWPCDVTHYPQTTFNGKTHS